MTSAASVSVIELLCSSDIVERGKVWRGEGERGDGGVNKAKLMLALLSSSFTLKKKKEKAFVWLVFMVTCAGHFTFSEFEHLRWFTRRR